MLKINELIGKVYKASEINDFTAKNGNNYSKVVLSIVSGVKHEVDGKDEYNNEFIELEFIEKKKGKDEKSYVESILKTYPKDSFVKVNGELAINPFVKKDGDASYGLKLINPNISAFEKSKEEAKDVVKEDETVEVEESAKSSTLDDITSGILASKNSKDYQKEREM